MAVYVNNLLISVATYQPLYTHLGTPLTLNQALALALASGGGGGDGAVLVGLGAPLDAVGDDGQVYLDVANLESVVIWGPKSGGTWNDSATLNGQAGADGAQIHSVNEPPDNLLGSDGDVAFDAVNKVFYPNKTAGAWPAGISFATATPDRRVHNTVGAPSNGVGLNDDWAFDVSAQPALTVYGPKSGGTWPAGFTIAGEGGGDGDMTGAEIVAAITAELGSSVWQQGAEGTTVVAAVSDNWLGDSVTQTLLQALQKQGKHQTFSMTPTVADDTTVLLVDQSTTGAKWIPNRYHRLTIYNQTGSGKRIAQCTFRAGGAALQTGGLIVDVGADMAEAGVVLAPGFAGVQAVSAGINFRHKEGASITAFVVLEIFW